MGTGAGERNYVARQEATDTVARTPGAKPNLNPSEDILLLDLKPLETAILGTAFLIRESFKREAPSIQTIETCKLVKKCDFSRM